MSNDAKYRKKTECQRWNIYPSMGKRAGILNLFQMRKLGCLNFHSKSLQRNYLIALQTFTSFFMSTKLAFEYLISKRNWHILESDIFFYLCSFLCRVWGTESFLCVCLDHFDNFLFYSFGGALWGFDLIKAELFSHQDEAI